MLLAEHAGLLLAAVRERDRRDPVPGDLADTLASGEVIGQAIGVVMMQRRCPPAEALDVLRGASTALSLPVEDVARRLVHSAEAAPGPPPPNPPAAPAWNRRRRRPAASTSGLSCISGPPPAAAGQPHASTGHAGAVVDPRRRFADHRRGRRTTGTAAPRGPVTGGPRAPVASRGPAGPAGCTSRPPKCWPVDRAVERSFIYCVARSPMLCAGAAHVSRGRFAGLSGIVIVHGRPRCR